MSEAITLGVNDEDIYCFRAFAYIQLSKYYDASEDYSKALEMNPSNTYVCQMRTSVDTKLDLEWTVLSPLQRRLALQQIGKYLPHPLNVKKESDGSRLGCVIIFLIFVAFKIFEAIF
jgi:tetratricopeptide (TPR) repeat protein